MHLAHLLAASIALGPAGTAATPASSPDPASQAQPQTMQAEAPKHPRGHKMVVAGVVLVVLGVASWAIMGAGLAVGNDAESRLDALGSGDDLQRRRDLLQRGRLGNGLAVGGGVAAAVLVGTGIPLIVIGRRRAIAATVGATPTPTGAAVGLRLRF